MLHLNNAPSQEVRIACEVITESPNKEAEAACDGIVFNADNWKNEQTIIVTGVDDHLKDGDQTYKIKVTTESKDPDFNNLVTESVELKNIDTTKPGFVLSKTTLMTYEDQEAEAETFTIALTSIPASDVKIIPTSSKPGEGTVSPASLTFNAGNWNVPQTIMVKGVDDEIQDGNVNYMVVFAPAETNDPNYDGFQASAVKVTNVDNDVAGISMNLHSEGFELTEGQEFPLKIKLNTQPNKDVKIAIAVDDATEAAFDPVEATLTPETWKTGVDVKLIGVSDRTIDGDQPVKLTFTATSADANYNLAPIVYEGIVKDVDVAEFTYILTSSPVVIEGRNDAVTLSLSLSSKPIKDITVNLTLTDESELRLDKQTLTFTPAQWEQPQSFSVYSVDDDIVDGNIKSKVVMTLASGDANFNGKSQEVEFTTVDDDEAGFVVVSNAASFLENGGATA
ncbi:MAG: hypothetical protein II180_04420, partial [Proteobacteria bacterium]|nr:hypothetical protein [Pseudomonadota bacterium]